MSHQFSFTPEAVEIPLPCTEEALANIQTWKARNDDEDEAERKKELFGEGGGDIWGKVTISLLSTLNSVA